MFQLKYIEFVLFFTFYVQVTPLMNSLQNKEGNFPDLCSLWPKIIYKKNIQCKASVQDLFI